MTEDPLQKEFSSEDVQRAEALYVCFDRPAFRQNFEAHTDIVGLMQAIDDTIAAINTGVFRRRDGLAFGHDISGRGYFDSKYLREAFGDIVRPSE